MKPASLKKVKASRVKEGDDVVVRYPNDVSGGYSAEKVRRVVPAAKKLADGEKQTPGHLMTITAGLEGKRFRVLPTADLFIVQPVEPKRTTRRVTSKRR